MWPAVERFQPELILVSAGFDGHWDDPLAGLSLTLDGYAHLTREIIRMAESVCDGRIVFVMEGGYNLDVIGNGIANVVRCLLGDEDTVDPIGAPKDDREPDVLHLIDSVRDIHGLGLARFAAACELRCSRTLGRDGVQTRRNLAIDKA